MKQNVKSILKYLLFFIIPILSVFMCIVFRIAQGEKTEEIIFGVMLGIVLDFVYFIALLLIKRKHNKL